MKISFFVNGSPDNVMGIRAKGLARFLSSRCTIDMVYRDEKKLRSLIRFFSAARKTRPDIIQVVGIGYSGVIAAIAAKAVLGSKVVIDTGDAVYELLKSSGNVSFLQCQMARLVEKAALTFSDRIVVQGSLHKEWLEQNGYRQVAHIPNGVDTTSIRPSNNEDLRDQLSINGHFTVGVMGSIVWSDRLAMCYGWDLIEALSLLKDIPVKGLIIGDGSGLPKLKQLAYEKDIQDRVIFAGHVPYSQIHGYLDLMDVCLSTQTNNLAGEVRTTAKLPEYLARGKYVIATEVGDAKYILPGIGMLLPYEGEKDRDYPKRLAERIRWLIDHKPELEKSKAGIQLAKERFDYPVLARQLEEVLEGALKG